MPQSAATVQQTQKTKFTFSKDHVRTQMTKNTVPKAFEFIKTKEIQYFLAKNRNKNIKEIFP